MRLLRILVSLTITVCFAGTVAIVAGYGMGLTLGYEADSMQNASIEINESGYLVAFGEETDSKIIDIVADNYEESDGVLPRTPLDDVANDRMNDLVNQFVVLLIEMADRGARDSYAIGSPWSVLIGFPVLMFGMLILPLYQWTGMHVRKMRA